MQVRDINLDASTTPTPTPTTTPRATPSPVVSPTPVITPTPTPTSSPKTTPTPTPEVKPSPTATPTPSSTNSAPVANAGADQTAYAGNIVTLDGSGSSDADGNVLTYSWAFTSKPSGSTVVLSDATVVKPTFTADKNGTYVVSLIVKDGMVNSNTDTVTINATNVTSGVIEAEIDIKPETINLKSKGKCKAFIKLPSPYKEDNIVTSTVVCEGAHATDGKVDSSNGGRYIATFNIQDLEVSTNSKREERVFTVTGELMDGTKFEGSNTVNVKGK